MGNTVIHGARKITSQKIKRLRVLGLITTDVAFSVVFPNSGSGSVVTRRLIRFGSHCEDDHLKLLVYIQ
jgi:hypothetical protein